LLPNTVEKGFKGRCQSKLNGREGGDAGKPGAELVDHSQKKMVAAFVSALVVFDG
jgi:hypothetical protein